MVSAGVREDLGELKQDMEVGWKHPARRCWNGRQN